MRNGNDSMPFDECIYGFLYFHFIFGVKRGGRFVKQDDLRRVLQDGTSIHTALPADSRPANISRPFLCPAISNRRDKPFFFFDFSIIITLF